MVKIVAALAAAFVVFFIITSPDAAASIYWHSWHAAVNVAHGLGHFVAKLTS